jgi:hypothetical protein
VCSYASTVAVKDVCTYNVVAVLRSVSPIVLYKSRGKGMCTSNTTVSKMLIIY